MSDKTSNNIGVLDVIQIVFIILKLCGLITWSWPIVLIPTWIVLVIVLIALISIASENIKRSRRGW